ncbi:MAG TPA: MucB/RseB C-terminal domain-containing protein [Burkholderiales bacterium]|nr:MucB/RseB C-terminal domain-containing protein [Burkholderiales bacterium]
MAVAARALAFLLLTACAGAQAQPPEALAWLRRIHDATQKLSYKGTFVYQQDGRTETSRITRYVDASGEIEKLESMDGAPREIVRTRDAVRCYLPESKTIKVDRRTPERDFPAMLPERVTALARHYEISVGELHRVAGYECREIVLKPKDNLRYGHRLYADTRSGMLLKAVTTDAAGQPIERITFTELTLGGVTRAMTRSQHESGSWRVEDAAASPASLPGWRLSAELPGFQKVVELKRRLESRPVSQMVFSDGLAAVSVFIEPLEGRANVRTGLASMGAIHIYTREVANHWVTVVGEAPAASVQRIADSVEYRRPQ